MFRRKEKKQNSTNWTRRWMETLQDGHAFLYHIVFYSLDTKWRQCLRTTVGLKFCFYSICRWFIYRKMSCATPATGSRGATNQAKITPCDVALLYRLLPTAFAVDVPPSAGCSRTQPNWCWARSLSCALASARRFVCRPSKPSTRASQLFALKHKGMTIFFHDVQSDQVLATLSCIWLVYIHELPKCQCSIVFIKGAQLATNGLMVSFRRDSVKGWVTCTFFRLFSFRLCDFCSHFWWCLCMNLCFSPWFQETI